MGKQWAMFFLAGCCVLLFGGSDSGFRTIDVTVRSSVDGRPMQGAELLVERAEDETTAINPPAEDVDSRTITRAESNDRGRILLTDLPLVPTRLTVKLDGYVAPAINNLDRSTPTRRLELHLAPAIEVTGLVVDDLGAPVGDVEVSVQAVYFDSAGRVVVAANSVPATTDASGKFRIKPVPEGTGTFNLSAKGYSFAADHATRSLSKEPIKLTVSRTGMLRVDIDAPLHKRGQYFIKVERRPENGGKAVVFEKPGADRGTVSFVDLPIGIYDVSATISSRKPEPPLTAVAEVKVAQPTEVRLGAGK